jgi:Sulfotransferase family
MLLGQSMPRVAFLHIPKCGGTSINYHFKSNYGGGRSRFVVLLDSMTGSATDPEQIAQARKAQFVGGHHGWATHQKVSQGAFSLTVLREPFSRLRSLYLFLRHSKRLKHHVFAKLAADARSHGFGDFCLLPDQDLRALVDNTQTRTLAGDFYPFEAVDRGQAVRAATNNLASFDMVADSKHIDAALPLLAAKTGTSVIESKTQRNRSPGVERVDLDRAEFMSDPRLFSLVAQDLDVYEHARLLFPLRRGELE